MFKRIRRFISIVRHKMWQFRFNRITKNKKWDLEDIIHIQTSGGNWNYDEYMHGLANGLLLAYSIVFGGSYTPLEAPDKWGKDASNKEAVVKEYVPEADNSML